MTTHNIYDPGDSPQHNIRSDLWLTMDLPALTNQQDLILTKLSTLSSMLGGNASQSHRDIYMAIEVALDEINKLIEHRSNNKTTTQQ